MSNNIDPAKVDGLTEEMKRAIKNRDAAALNQMLSEDERKLLNSLLKNKSARDNLLNSPQIKNMLDSLLKGR